MNAIPRPKGLAACYCNDGCQESFRTDRSLGLIYGAVLETLDGQRTGRYWTHEHHSDSKGLCRYCGARVRAPAPIPAHA